MVEYREVERIGKGMYLGVEDEIVFQNDKLVPYLPSKDEAIKIGEMSEEQLKDYDEWSVLEKMASVDWWCVGYFVDKDYFNRPNQIIANAMHFCFEKRYGYPLGSFGSVCDAEHNVMIFCEHFLWPPKEYNQNLAELTEGKLEKQLQEFLVEITGDLRYANKKLELCEDYGKY
ncbi:hypothetical protein [Brotaphodocola sp.]|uniref:hypothetical protein n=1 Tax=Brotaphodocola sp. TaxID=3073577 RepID=UPI003D7CABCE